MDTTTKTPSRTIVYGRAAYGGKVHVAHGGIAGCLSGNGHKPIRLIVAEIPVSDDGRSTGRERAEALIAAGVNHSTMCRKCAGHVADLMQEAGA